MEKNLNEEILRQLLLINFNRNSILSEQNVEENESSVIDILFETNEDDIAELISKSGKSLEELLSGRNLTLNDIKILFQIAKLTNNEIYNNILSQLTESEIYKSIFIEQYNLFLDEFSKKLTSNPNILKYYYSSLIKDFTTSFAKLIGADFTNAEKIILDYYQKNIIDLWDDYDLNGVTNEYLKHSDENNDFYVFTTEQPNYSGWKIYIYSNSVNQLLDILQKIGDYIKSINYPFKVATKKEMSKNLGKGIIIYLPYDSVINKEFKSVFETIKQKLSGIQPGGTIQGSKNYSGPIFYSYEFNKKFEKLPKNGVTVNDLNKYYTPNSGGDYMRGIKQKDLFDE